MDNKYVKLHSLLRMLFAFIFILKGNSMFKSLKSLLGFFTIKPIFEEYFSEKIPVGKFILHDDNEYLKGYL